MKKYADKFILKGEEILLKDRELTEEVKGVKEVVGSGELESNSYRDITSAVNHLLKNEQAPVGGSDCSFRVTGVCDDYTELFNK